MMIASNYSINVARLETQSDGVEIPCHYCRIELGNMLQNKAEEIFWDICNRFPSADFDLTLDYVDCRSQTIAVAERR